MKSEDRRRNDRRKVSLNSEAEVETPESRTSVCGCGCAVCAMISLLQKSTGKANEKRVAVESSKARGDPWASRPDQSAKKREKPESG